jgi:hypothetical protein
MAKISESDLQAALTAILEREKAEPPSAQMARDSQILALRRKLREQLFPVISQAGFDQNKINPIILQHQKDVKTLLESTEAEVEKELVSQIKNYQEGLSNKRSAYELSGRKPLTVTPIVVDTAFGVFAFPSGILVDSHMESWNNWAKLFHASNLDSGGELKTLRFFFSWKNESDYLVIINAVTELAAQGRCTINAVPGTFFGGRVFLRIESLLRVFLMGGPTLTSNSLQHGVILTGTIASTWGSIFGGDPEMKIRDVNTVNNLSCPSILVQPGQLVIFDVVMEVLYSIDNGSVLIDFDRDHLVTCPALIVELLTAPTVTGNLGVVEPDRTL